MAPRTVLCIDDEEIGLEVRRLLLEKAGYRVLAACSGAEGLALFDSQPVDAVVLDYAMPEMNGGEVARALRRRNSQVPILMLSAYLSLPEEVRSVADAVATKGEDPATLLDVLGRLLANPPAL